MTRLTIGMPLYNNARTIERAVKSLQQQTFGDFRLLMSDDGSTDDTPAIAERLAAGDSRLTFTRQPRNLNYGNFRYVLSRAETPLFAFAAGDDWWLPTYMERCVELLDKNPEAVCATTRTCFVYEDGESFVTPGTVALTGSPEENIAKYFDLYYENSRMYGVFRTGVAKRAFPNGDHYAYDVTFSAASMREGVHLEYPEVLMHREITPPERYIEYVRRDNGWWLTRFFPLLPMTWSLFVEKRIPRTRKVIAALLNVNLLQHRVYVERFHPRLLPLSDKLLRWFSVH